MWQPKTACQVASGYGDCSPMQPLVTSCQLTGARHRVLSAVFGGLVATWCHTCMLLMRVLLSASMSPCHSGDDLHQLVAGWLKGCFQKLACVCCGVRLVICCHTLFRTAVKILNEMAFCLLQGVLCIPGLSGCQFEPCKSRVSGLHDDTSICFRRPTAVAKVGQLFFSFSPAKARRTVLRAAA